MYEVWRQSLQIPREGKGNRSSLTLFLSLQAQKVKVETVNAVTSKAILDATARLIALVLKLGGSAGTSSLVFLSLGLRSKSVSEYTLMNLKLVMLRLRLVMEAIAWKARVATKQSRARWEVMLQKIISYAFKSTETEWKTGRTYQRAKYMCVHV